MKRIYTTLSILFACVSFSFAQQKSPNTIGAVTQTATNSSHVTVQKAPSISELKMSLEGSYRIDITKTNYQILYTRDLLETIKNSRKEDEDIVIQWDQYITITIYSYKTLENNSTN
jgi:hypothetical protein